LTAYLDTDADVYAMALDGTTLYFAGNFTLVGVTARQGIAAINAQTGSLLSWDPGVSGGVQNVRRIVVSGANVYVFGDFTTAGGSSRSGAAAIDKVTGVATAWDPSPNGDVIDAIIDTPTSLVYMAGLFTTLSGSGRNRVGSVDLTTAAIGSWDPDADAGVYSMSRVGNNIYMGGDFNNVGGAARNRVAAIDVNTSLATSWDPNADSTVSSVLADPFNVYLGGAFTTIGGFSRSRLAEVRTFDAGLDPFDPSPDSTVVNMQLYSSTELYISGAFTTVGGSSRSKFASINPVFSTANAWVADSAGGSNFGRVTLRTPYAVFVGGQFTSINSVSKTGIAATVP
jgi:hypothetical protein